MLYLTYQWPRKGVMPFEVWARNDEMTVIKLLFKIFLPQIQILTLFPRNRKSRCIDLPRLVLGSTSTLGRRGRHQKSWGTFMHASHLERSACPRCLGSPLGSSWAFGQGMCLIRSQVNFMARKGTFPRDGSPQGAQGTS
jgi:hypothetical protein